MKHLSFPSAVTSYYYRSVCIDCNVIIELSFLTELSSDADMPMGVGIPSWVSLILNTTVQTVNIQTIAIE